MKHTTYDESRQEMVGDPSGTRLNRQEGGLCVAERKRTLARKGRQPGCSSHTPSLVLADPTNQPELSGCAGENACPLTGALNPDPEEGVRLGTWLARETVNKNLRVTLYSDNYIDAGQYPAVSPDGAKQPEMTCKILEEFQDLRSCEQCGQFVEDCWCSGNVSTNPIEMLKIDLVDAGELDLGEFLSDFEWDKPIYPFNFLLRLKSALNGNNGEATNSDDMSSEMFPPLPHAIGPSPQNSVFNGASRIAVVREAVQNQRTANATNAQSMAGGNKEDKLKKAHKQLKEQEKIIEGLQKYVNEIPDKVPEPEEQLTCIVVRSKVPNALYQLPNQYNLSYTTYQALKIMDRFTNGPLTMRFEIVDEFVGQCVSAGSGWAVVSSKEEKNVLVKNVKPATNLITKKGFRYKDSTNKWINVPAKEFAVYEPLWTKLNTQFKAASLTESIVNAAVVNSTLTFDQHEITDSTVDCYIRYITERHYKSIANSRNGVVIQNNGNVIAKGDDGLWSVRDTSANCTDIHMAWQEPDVECKLDLDWEVRKDFKITKNQSTTHNDGLAADIGPKGHIIMRPGVKEASRYRTKFFSFAGLNLPDFLEYNNSANNLTHGLKRLIGGKKGELAFRRNAMLLGAHLAVRLSKWCNNPYGGEYSILRIFSELIGKRLNGKEWVKYGDARAYVDAMLEHKTNSASVLAKTWKGRHPCIEVSVDKTTNTHQSKIVFNPTKDPLYEQREFIASVMCDIWSDSKMNWIQKASDYLANGGHWAYWTLADQFLTQFASVFPRSVVANIQHVKRELRRRYVDGVKLEADDNILVDRLDVLIKRELAKFGKAPRLYVAYSEGCVYANELPEFAKMGINGKHYYSHKGITCIINIMAKPRPKDLGTIFTELHDAMASENTLYVAIYSDDMCMAGNIGGRVIAVNLDIESNDSSQDAPSFISSHAVLSNFSRSRAAGLIRQCLRPMIITNPEDLKSFLEIKFDGPIEGSGSVLTTLLNHLGSALIAASILFVLAEFTKPLILEDEDSLEKICKGAANVVGHSITFDSCMPDRNINFHHFQFLKRSPFRVGDKWHPYMNLGCILRSLGSVDDNLEPRQLGLPHSKFVALTNEERINLFCGAIVNGWKYEPSNPIMNALRERFGSVTDEVSYSDSQVHVFDVTNEKPIDYSMHDNTAAIMARYDLSVEEISELAQQIQNVHVGQLYRSVAMAKILHVDYGVKFT